MFEITKERVFIFVLIVFLIWMFYPAAERFNADGTEFTGMRGSGNRYGLRGDRIHSVPIDNYFIKPDRQIRLSHSTGMMWETDNIRDPTGFKDGCYKVPCPTNTNEYDSLDTCWKCGNQCPEKQKIIPIHPH